MSENQYIKKRKRLRDRPFITTKAILMLVGLSGFIYLGFYSEYGGVNDAACDGACESTYSLWTSVFAFLLMFAAIIGAGAIVGVLVAKFGARKSTDAVSIYQQNDENIKD
ncbi:hypothetical protein KFE96_17605 [Kordiimonas sp. SCSIO 12603]|uniref:hypothetical protein n=1 Tax=Kordiimonas sp. SCSIO 12603 TaxID=2829596 RepID=UPI0021075CCA|nr:hypothetical protein [Kordiimonas sp. SCSIO 12603]UTW58609.1 hypothetical protein KFE96_17605 [Kordiimonas sp. SCSIO 12603]